MRAWTIPATLFCVGLGLGLSIPIFGPRYMEPYMPDFFQKPLHPLEGIVTRKQRDQDRLLMTVTTQDGTILATFKIQVAEIELLVEEQDSITLDVKQYEPFVNDPPILKVNKRIPQDSIPSPALDTSSPSTLEKPEVQEHEDVESSPSIEETIDSKTLPPTPSIDDSEYELKKNFGE